MTEAPKGRGRRQFVLLAALFAAPLVAAWLLYFYLPEWVPQARGNYGRLVDPARPLPLLALAGADGAATDTAALKGKWTYVYLGAGPCADACRNKLFQIRQIRAALNEKRGRVQRVYVAPSVAAAQELQAQLGREHPDLRVLADPQGALRGFFEPRDPDAVYLLDPHGNWLLEYPALSESRGIHKDIKRLLRLSQIG
ncbi:MAG: SCO family protein [Gammaproteobacteria bacterium]|nr:SCO family protein [Gammaproteobacteria bacterium]